MRTSRLLPLSVALAIAAAPMAAGTAALADCGQCQHPECSGQTTQTQLQTQLQTEEQLQTQLQTQEQLHTQQHVQTQQHTQAQQHAQTQGQHGQKIGITMLAFAGPRADEITKVRELDVTGGDVTVKVLVQFKAKVAVKPAANAVAQWKTTVPGGSAVTGTPDIALTRTGAAKRVSNWRGSLLVPSTAVNGTVYCLTGATVDEQPGTLNLSTGQAKRSCFTVVSAVLPTS